jgi:DNA-binding NarL/FixJ family response regulator
MHSPILFNNTKNINLILVDNDIQFRNPLKKALENNSNFNLIAEASSLSEFENLTILHRSNIVIIDLEIPLENLFEEIQKIIWDHPNLGIIGISNKKIDLQILVELGFKGCICKNASLTILSEAINNIYQGKFYFQREILLKS